MDKIIGKGKISANSVIVYPSKLLRFFRRKKVTLSFTDKDAYPFARFLIIGVNQEVQSKFFLGKQGTTHGSLFQLANIENQKILGKDWIRDNQYKNLTNILSAGRIWTSSQILVMRDPRPSHKIVKYVISQLCRQGINNIENYRMLYEDNQSYIHECNVKDYLDGCASQYGYQTNEEIPTVTPSITKSKRFIEPMGMSQAEYNYYKRYGLGDSKIPKVVNLADNLNAPNKIIKKKFTLRLTESQLKKLITECVMNIIKKVL